MALVTKSIKGTLDVLPNESYKRQFVEHSCLEIAENLKLQGVRPFVLDMAPHVLPGFDVEMSEYIENKLLLYRYYRYPLYLDVGECL